MNFCDVILYCRPRADGSVGDELDSLPSKLCSTLDHVEESKTQGIYTVACHQSCCILHDTATVARNACKNNRKSCQ